MHSPKRRSSNTERKGVTAVQAIICQTDHIFREQLVQDMGIDAQIEIVDKGGPTGKLIGVQIKSGASHFHETKAGYIYYGDNVHFEYWLRHSLPVIFIGHIPDLDLTFWSVVNKETAQSTPKGWKITLPKDQLLTAESANALAEIAEGSPDKQRFTKLSLDEPLMRHIAKGGKVSLEIDDWINKSLKRTMILVYLHDEDGKETLEREWGTAYTGYTIPEFLKLIFPWATPTVDEDFYSENEDIRDSSDWLDDVYHTSSSRDLRPYTESWGEIESYRIELILNDIGKAFLTLSKYLADGLTNDKDEEEDYEED